MGQEVWELNPTIWAETVSTIQGIWWTSVYAARVMAKHCRGVIAHVTDHDSRNPPAYRGQTLHDLGHESMNRMINAMAADTTGTGVTVVGLNPGFMRTERVLMFMTSDEIKKQFRFDLSESPEYLGRAVAALATDPDPRRHNGRLLLVAELAKEYGFTDIDGRQIPVFDPHAPAVE